MAFDVSYRKFKSMFALEITENILLLYVFLTEEKEDKYNSYIKIRFNFDAKLTHTYIK